MQGLEKDYASKEQELATAEGAKVRSSAYQQQRSISRLLLASQNFTPVSCCPTDTLHGMLLC